MVYLRHDYHRRQKEQKETAAKHIKEIAIIESPNARRQEEGKEAAAKQIKEIAILESLKTVRSGRMKRSTRSTGQTAAREPSFCTRRRTSRAAVRAINNVATEHDRVPL